MINSLIQLFSRDLNALKKEINSYSSEELLWKIKNDLNNSGGNLCLHIVGNLNHFIGATLGNNGYIRKRDLEFSLKNIPVTEMVKQIDEVIVVIETVLLDLSKNDLKKKYPLNVFGYEMTTEFFLIHLTTHLSYHLGQINYHRRLIV